MICSNGVVAYNFLSVFGVGASSNAMQNRFSVKDTGRIWANKKYAQSLGMSHLVPGDGQIDTPKVELARDRR